MMAASAVEGSIITAASVCMVWVPDMMCMPRIPAISARTTPSRPAEGRKMPDRKVPDRKVPGTVCNGFTRWPSFLGVCFSLAAVIRWPDRGR
jgi:hypothetical protein